MSNEDTRLTKLPTWAESTWQSTIQSITNLTKSIIKVNRAVTNLENHATMGTYPNSITINVKIQVEKENQPHMDEIIKNANELWQKTILGELIMTRKKEAADKKQALAKIKADFLKYFMNNLTDLKTNNLINSGENELRAWYGNIERSLQIKAIDIERELRVEEHFANKKKLEDQEARRAARQEERINQELLDPAMKTMQSRVESLEAQLKKATAASSSTKPTSKNKETQPAKKPKTKNPKGKGPSQPNRPDGPGKQGRGKGNRKPKQNSTPSIAQSGSRKKN